MQNTSSQEVKNKTSKGSASGTGTQCSSGSGANKRRESSNRAQRNPRVERLDAGEAKEELLDVLEAKDEVEAKVLALEKQVSVAEAVARQEAQKALESTEEASEAVQAKEAAKVDLLIDVKQLKVKTDTLQDKLANTRMEKQALKADRDQLADTVEALKARHEVELQKVKEKHLAQLEMRWQEEKEKASEAEAAKAKANMLAEQLAQAEREKERVKREAELLRVKEAMSRTEAAAKAAKVEALKAEASEDAKKVVEQLDKKLQDEMSELQKKVKILEFVAPVACSSTATCSTISPSNFGSSSGRKGASEHPAPERPVHQGRQPTLNIPKGSRSFGVLSRMPLMTIIEGEDMQSGDGSVADCGASVVAQSATGASCQFSSNGDETVGDMHDFDDAVEDPLALIKRANISIDRAVKEPVNTAKEAIKLKITAEKVAEKVIKEKDQMAEELAKKKREKEELKQKVLAQEAREHALQEELAEKLAADESKIERLQRQLSARHSETEEMDEWIMSLKQQVEAKDVRLEAVTDRLDFVWHKAENREANLKYLRAELEAKQGRTEELHNWAMEMQEQLDLALEGKRLAEARCEDLRMALSAEESRNAKAEEELQREIQLLKFKSTDSAKSSCSSSDEVSDLKTSLAEARSEAQRLEEERNILQNILEWKEVQFRNTVEDLEAQVAMAQAEAAKNIKQEVRRGGGDLLSKLDQQAEALRQRLAGDVTPGSASTRDRTFGGDCTPSGPQSEQHNVTNFPAALAVAEKRSARADTVSEGSSQRSMTEDGNH